VFLSLDFRTVNYAKRCCFGVVFRDGIVEECVNYLNIKVLQWWNYMTRKKVSLFVCTSEVAC
jgi:hypothetical protein